MWLWAAEFKLSDEPKRAMAAHKAYALIFTRGAAQELQSFQPDLVVTTYPFLTVEVTHAMRQIGRRVPFAMLLADPNGVHVSWLSEKNAEAVFAPTHETYDQALAAGFPPQRVHLTGWNVRQQFYLVQPQPQTESGMLEQLGLRSDRFTVFLQGGGEGAAKFAQTVENVLALEGTQVILAAGTNTMLFERFRNKENLHALPFTREIAPYMMAADVVMGKAGPNMLFEAVTLGKPFIATSYIPGQEEVNMEFIERHHLGWVALSAPEQRALIESLMQNPERLKEMRSSVSTYSRWNNTAAETLPGLVEGLLKMKRDSGIV
jgi:UDP-N-acetylglucosamine:LPS N-acetylglucosamine transferase